MMLPILLMRSWMGALLLGCLLAAAICGCESPAQERPTADRDKPTARPLPGTGDWPAFQRGGRLHGRGDDVGQPPMRVRWTYQPAEGGFHECSPVVADGVVYVADDWDSVHAIDLSTGKRRWRFKGGESFGSTPLVLGDRVIVGDLSGLLFALRTSTGEEIWRLDAGAPIRSSPMSADGRVVLATGDGTIWCVDAISGEKIWSKRAGDRIDGAPAIHEGLAWLAGCDGQLRAFSVADGEQVFVADMGQLTGAAPALIDAGIVIGTDGGRIICLDDEGGDLRWTFNEVRGEQMVYSSPAVDGEVAVAGADDRHVYAVNVNTGRRVWSFRTRGEVKSSPAIASGRVYIGSSDRHFYVLGLTDGKELWSYQCGGAITGSPAIAGGLVIVGDSGQPTGTLYCFEPAPMNTPK
jgi:outer membrane protein assembly factor BamB